MPDEPMEDELLAGAYLDGALDAAAARQFEARMAGEPALAATHARMKSLRHRLHEAREDDEVPASLRARLAGAPPQPALRRMSRSWGAMAASLLVGIVVGGAATLGLVAQPGGDAAAPFVAAHLRALMAPQPVDVVSSDHHTVKPWFDGRLTFAPKVLDLAVQGFPLVGGRVDVVDLQPAAALVYRAGKHLISLTELPGSASASPAETIDRGYIVLHWGDGEVSYWAVSDAAASELRDFVDALRAADR